MNRREAIRHVTRRLEFARVPSADVEAEHLVAEVLGCSRPMLWMESQRLLEPAEMERLQDWLTRREQRVPLQHLSGLAPFLDWMFRVSPAVLVPRPETEGLARRAMEVLVAREQAAPGRPQRVLDFATGSGCLAVSIAKRHPQACVTALDISAPALKIARTNAADLLVANRIDFREGDGFAALGEGPLPHARFDLIVSNPPYLPTAEIASLEPEVRDHDPRLALDGGADGLDFYRRLAREAPAWLVPDGLLLAEFGDGQGPDILALFRTGDWDALGCEPDLAGRDRLLVARRR